MPFKNNGETVILRNGKTYIYENHVLFDYENNVKGEWELKVLFCYCGFPIYNYVDWRGDTEPSFDIMKHFDKNGKLLWERTD